MALKLGQFLKAEAKGTFAVQICERISLGESFLVAIFDPTDDLHGFHPRIGSPHDFGRI